jgi:hypothetical protein
LYGGWLFLWACCLPDAHAIFSRPWPQATLAACNVAATLQGYPAWTQADVLPFVDGPFEEIPKAAPSIVNAKELNLKTV